jgi:hypothetical protein
MLDSPQGCALDCRTNVAGRDWGATMEFCTMHALLLKAQDTSASQWTLLSKQTGEMASAGRPGALPCWRRYRLSAIELLWTEPRQTSAARPFPQPSPMHNNHENNSPHANYRHRDQFGLLATLKPHLDCSHHNATCCTRLIPQLTCHICRATKLITSILSYFVFETSPPANVLANLRCSALTWCLL